MFGWFRKRPLLDPAAAEWIVEAFEWALYAFGTDYFAERTVLVKPNDRHFPDRIGNANDLALKIFERVRAFSGMEGWPCRLAMQEADPSIHMAPAVLVQGAPQGPAGTFRMRTSEDGAERHALITFNPKQLGDPESLVATFAHELAHYLAHSVKEKPPGGEEFEELATDVLAVVTGFGLFIANSAFKFRQYQSGTVQGWSVRQQGYLGRYEATYALAIFCALKDIPRREVEPHLQSSLIPAFRQAWREIDGSTAIVRLRRIDVRKNPGNVRTLPGTARTVEAS